MKVNVTYLDHCGYVVETPEHLLVFDKIKGELPNSNKTKLCFITHGHSDHYQKEIFDENYDVFIVSDDIDASHDKIKWVKCGDQLNVGSVNINVLGSTDLGVSFLVEVDGVTLFYGGDLNDWHWKTESTQDEIDEMNQWFTQLIEPLRDKKIDCLFFDVDPRLEVDIDQGLKQVLELCEARYIFPMHFTSNLNKIKEYYLNKTFPQMVEIVDPGTEIELEW